MKREWKMAGFRGSRPFYYKGSLSGEDHIAGSQSSRAAIAPLRIGTGMFFLFLAVVFSLFPAKTVCAEPVRIVIDPGHGGENLGAQYNGYTEKYMTMVVANAMAEELRKYEGVEVYLTRTEDKDLSLQQRADYAKEVNADFLFCLHFNMSERHTLYGMEVWVSAFGNCYAEGKGFGELCLNELGTLDLYRRGVKTRLDDSSLDYYGIIRHCREYGIPSAIIEHCHMDNREDAGRFETTEAMKRLGVLDATAAAKYYGLYSPTLGVDYRKYEKPKVKVPSEVMEPDSTEPVNVSLTCLRTKPETGEVNILLTGEDPESGLLYYDYSINGGLSYSGLQKWGENGGELECTLKVPLDQDIALKCRIYNGYDLDTETETVEIAALRGKAEDGAGDESAGNGFSGGDVSGQGTEGLPENQEASGEEALETSGKAHQIDMRWYEEQDAEKQRDKMQVEDADVSRLLWLAILAFLVSVLIVLMAARASCRKRQKKAKYRGRKR